LAATGIKDAADDIVSPENCNLSHAAHGTE